MKRFGCVSKKGSSSTDADIECDAEFLRDGNTWSLVETRTFVYDDWNLIHETRTDELGTVTRLDYFWGPDLSGSLQGAGGVGGLVAVSVDGAWYFPGYDNNGNVIGYWDERGRLAAEFVYDAFGNPVGGHDAPYVHLPHRFSTKYHDAETDLYYYGYRYYSPSLGRWISRDPIEERKENNLLSFCKNNGLIHFDMLGRESEPSEAPDETETENFIHVDIDYELWFAPKRKQIERPLFSFLVPFNGTRPPTYQESSKLTIEPAGSKQTISGSEGYFTFRIMPHIGFPPEIKRIFYPPSNPPISGGAFAGNIGTHMRPPMPGYSTEQLYGSAEVTKKNARYNYHIFEYPNALFSINRTIRLLHGGDDMLDDIDETPMFRRWDNQNNSPTPTGDRSFFVQCGDKIIIKVSNGGVLDVDNEFTIGK